MTYKNRKTIKNKLKRNIGGWQPIKNSRKINKSKKIRVSKNVNNSNSKFILTSAQTGKQ